MSFAISLQKIQIKRPSCIIQFATPASAPSPSGTPSTCRPSGNPPDCISGKLNAGRPSHEPYTKNVRLPVYSSPLIAGPDAASAI